MPLRGGFLTIRGGQLDVSLLGWITEDPAFPRGVGGTMDLAVGAWAIRVIMDHTGITPESCRPSPSRSCNWLLTGR